MKIYFIKFDFLVFEENIDAHASVTEFEKNKISTQKNFLPRIELGIRYRPTKPFTTFVAKEKKLLFSKYFQVIFFDSVTFYPEERLEL